MRQTRSSSRFKRATFNTPLSKRSISIALACDNPVIETMPSPTFLTVPIWLVKSFLIEFPRSALDEDRRSWFACVFSIYLCWKGVVSVRFSFPKCLCRVECLRYQSLPRPKRFGKQFRHCYVFRIQLLRRASIYFFRIRQLKRGCYPEFG